ncbi:energy transducer TonB [Microbulbifer sp. ALW1]|uniref:energy transducer TonB n=1 Tax=Microbulbifer sp. (strain ALW1) TaxID=1516059 RepID=UPI00135712FC|nr:hypothetical protein [Microbulbifer sp. ALW1]
MVKRVLIVASMLFASQAFSLDWQRPDCSAYESFSECRNAEKNAYRQSKQQEFREKGLSFWYYERPDFSENEAVEKALEDKVEGALFFSFDVEKNGSVSGLTLKHKTSEEVAVYAAPLLAAIKNWQFVPAETSWKGLEWRYQFYFEPKACDGEEPATACEDKAEGNTEENTESES